MRKATPQEIEAARTEAAVLGVGCAVEVYYNAMTTRDEEETEGGYFVQAWIYVPCDGLVCECGRESVLCSYDDTGSHGDV